MAILNDSQQQKEAPRSRKDMAASIWSDDTSFRIAAKINGTSLTGSITVGEAEEEVDAGIDDR